MDREGFAVLRDALGDRAGVGRLSIGGREHLIAVMADAPGLVLWQLRRADEVRSVSSLQDVAGLPTPSAEALKLARQMVDGMTADTAPVLDEPDPVEAARRRLVGGQQPSADVVDLTEQLRASLRLVKPKRPRRRKTAPARARKGAA